MAAVLMVFLVAMVAFVLDVALVPPAADQPVDRRRGCSPAPGALNAR
jgi:hypothetical protein